MSAMPKPVRPLPPSRKSNWPFWLFVPPGIEFTLIWSKSSSPDHSTATPAFSVCRPFTHVRASAHSQMGPSDDDGYGPPSIVVNLSMLIVGILSSISLPG